MRQTPYLSIGYAEKVTALLAALWFMLFWLTAYFMISRYVMFGQFVDPADLVGHESEVWNMWLTGLRYDARVCAIMLLPVFALGLLLCAGQASWRFFLRLGPPLFWLAALTAALFAVGNYYYYQTYHNFIDIFVFGFAGEDQAAVLGNIWDDYPVILFGLAMLGLSLLPAWLGGRILRAPLTRRRRNPQQFSGLWGLEGQRGLPGTPGGRGGSRFWLFLLLSAALFFLIARGSLDTFPLGRNAARVSSLGVLNQLTPNGLITFHWARQDYGLETAFHPVTAAEGEDLLRRAGLPALLERTPHNAWLKANPPHVVLALLESFGSNLLVLDDPPRNDLLGALRPHFTADFLFRRFLPEGNGTAPSLAALFFSSPVQNISHSVAQNTPLPYTSFQVFRQAGYGTVFIYPGNMMWRNLSAYLPRQGVDRFFDENEIIALYPEAARQRTAWGVPDEFAYRLAEKLLLESERPLFIGILTTTNHPPYRMPDTYAPAPLALTGEAEARMLDDAAQNLLMFGAYQYAADSLGRFMGRVKASPLGAKTLVAASGDHQMRRMRPGAASEQALDLGVPFYLFVPGPVLNNVPWRFEAARPGSHKDILPTLFALSLSEAEFLALGGRNLLAEADDPDRSFGYNERVWIDGTGVYFYGGRAGALPWADAGTLLVGTDAPDALDGPDGPEDLAAAGVRRRMEAYPKLLRWQLNARVSGQDDLLHIRAR